MTAPARTTAYGVDGLTGLVGRRLGPSSWLDVTRAGVDGFAAATGDRPGPAAPGYLTLSLTPVVLTEILDVRGFSLVVNYGCERVRFPEPVPVGGRVRASAVVDDVRLIDGGAQAAVTLTFEAESGAGPACVAGILVRYYA